MVEADGELISPLALFADLGNVAVTVSVLICGAVAVVRIRRDPLVVDGERGWIEAGDGNLVTLENARE